MNQCSESYNTLNDISLRLLEQKQDYFRMSDCVSRDLNP